MEARLVSKETAMKELKTEKPTLEFSVQGETFFSMGVLRRKEVALIMNSTMSPVMSMEGSLIENPTVSDIS